MVKYGSDYKNEMIHYYLKKKTPVKDIVRKLENEGFQVTEEEIIHNEYWCNESFKRSSSNI